MSRPRIEGILENAGVATAEALSRAAEFQVRERCTLPHALAALGLADEEAVCRVIANALRFTYVALDDAEVDTDLVSRLPAGFCQHRLAVPLASDTGVRLAMAEPLNYRAVQDVEFRTGKSVIVVVASERTVRVLLERLEGDHADRPLYELLAGTTQWGEAEFDSGESHDGQGE